MRHSKLLLAVLGATVLLGALVATASATRFSFSTQAFSGHWNRLDFTGGFGTIECEIDLAGSLHSSTFTKTADSLIGYITSANIPRCTRGGFTILRETLPWHRTYRSFSGALPEIAAISSNILGYAFKMREPSIGATCLARSSAASPTILSYNREAGGTITSITMSGSIPCIGAITRAGTISGTSTTTSAGRLTLI